MIKYVFLIMAAVFLTACKPDTRETLPSDSGMAFIVECIDGVEYWLWYKHDLAVLSPRIDPTSLTFVRCGSK